MPVEYRYIDIIWLDNLVMNFIILWASSKLTKNSTSLYRLLAASFLGATYAVLLVVYQGFIFSLWVIKLLLSIIMILIGFKFTSLVRLIRLMAVFYGVTFAFGGGALGLYFFTKDIITLDKGIFYIKNFPAKIIFMSSLLLIIFIYAVWPRIRSKLAAENLIYSIKIKYNGRDIVLNALLDTGNLLYDPITKNPVIIVEYTKIQETLPLEVRKIYRSNRELDMNFIIHALKDSAFIERIRLIPYYTLGKPGGLLLGFRPEKVLVSKGNNWYEYKGIIVAIYNDKLSKDDSYDALIHPDILSA